MAKASNQKPLEAVALPIEDVHMHVHIGSIREAAKMALGNESVIFDIAEIFKICGDETRVRIICALFTSEYCVMDLAGLLGMTSSAISHQLRVLKQSRIVKSRRDGKLIYYSLADTHIEEIFRTAFEHVLEGE